MAAQNSKVSRTSSGKRKIVWAGSAVLALSACGWGVMTLAKGDKTAVPKELSVDALKAKSNDPGQMFDQVRQAMDNGNLTEEQRHQVWRNVHDAMDARMDQRLNEYFTASADQKQAILDRHIDEMQARMKDMEQRRARRDREADSSRSATGGPGGSNAGPGPGGGPGDRDRFSGGSREARKLRSESRDPDQRARFMAYFSAMHKRADQRGVQIPDFGRGRP